MSELNIEYKFMRDPATGISKQEDFFYETKRNICFSGGFGNGKSYGGSQKILFLLTQFPNYRVAVLRASSSDLRRTTQATFFKICPPDIINHVEHKSYTDFNNGSRIYWLHLDNYDENIVKGLEINTALTDQAEEIGEQIYLILDSRVGRWDMAEVPEHLKPERFPKNPATGKPMAPSYNLLLCNPDEKHHWIYRRFHPESVEHNQVRERLNRRTGKQEIYKWSDTHVMIQATSYENPALSEETLKAMEDRGPSFVKRFVMGEWGSSGGSLFDILPESKLYEFPEHLFRTILSEGRLYRSLDHGDASPTVVLWYAVWKRWIFVYREYYRGGESISEHRKNIEFLSQNEFGIPEKYQGNFADPSIFNKTQQKKGGVFSLADEYITDEYKGLPIFWQPSDNNEYLTRSKVQESLKRREHLVNPISLDQGSPKVFFIMQTKDYQMGCNRTIIEIESQKYEKIGTINGQDVFSDDRDGKVTDHAYDSYKYGIVSIMDKYQDETAQGWQPPTFRDAQRMARQHRMNKRLIMAGVMPHSGLGRN